MRVLHVITGLGPGGSEAMLMRLTRTLAGGDCASAILTLSSDRHAAQIVPDARIPVWSLPFDQMTRLPAIVNPVWSEIRNFKPDVVQGWLIHGNLGASLVGAMLRVPTAWNVRHRLDRSGDRRVLSKRTSALIRMSAVLSSRPRVIVYNSRKGREDHEAIGYDRARGVVIPNGFDVIRFAPSAKARSDVRAELGLGEDALILGLVARWNPVKDHDTFLAAARAILDRGFDVTFVLVGRGMDCSNAELREKVDQFGVSHAVRLLGERADVAVLTAAFDVACCSSISEGMPNALGEAMSSGVPCVTTNVGDAEYLVADTGYVIASGDSAAFAEACVKLLNLSRPERTQIGRAARDRIEKFFSMKAVSRQYFDMYDRIMVGSGN